MSAIARRDFLSAVAAAPLAFGAAGTQPLARKSCIFLVLTGGPSQLDTWDPKPDAPREIRSPFRPIRTNVAGIEISEIFPHMAKQADQFTLIRSVYSDAMPVHEHALSEIDQATEGFIELPGPVGFMGIAANRAAMAEDVRPGSFADHCLHASKLVAAGVRGIRVNMFQTVFHKPTWDSHGSRPFSTMEDYRSSVAPAFDLGFTTLLTDLTRRDLLDSTLVIAMGEFGRSPRINPSGGRDHWPGCRTVIMAGGGMKGGQIIGSSDAIGGEPRDNPVTVSQIVAMIDHRLDRKKDRGWAEKKDRPGNIAEPVPDFLSL